MYYIFFYAIQVSGTAAKLGKPNAYHHCTLLVNVDKANLSSTLEKKEVRFFLYIIDADTRVSFHKIYILVS